MMDVTYHQYTSIEHLLCTKPFGWRHGPCCHAVSHLVWEVKPETEKEEFQNNPSQHVLSVKNECEAHPTSFYPVQCNDPWYDAFFLLAEKFLKQRSQSCQYLNFGMHYFRGSLTYVNFRPILRFQRYIPTVSVT